MKMTVDKSSVLDKPFKKERSRSQKFSGRTPQILVVEIRRKMRYYIRIMFRERMLADEL